MRKVLHLLSQRPALTGSGVTLDALVRHADRAGWEQQVVVGVPRDDMHPAVGELEPARIRPLIFGGAELDFPVPGMSDVMPYPSSRFSALTDAQIATYETAWDRHLSAVLADFRPDVIHSHHLWLMSSRLKDLAADIPVATQCHATGFRQMALCPQLAPRVRAGCARNDAFLVLHREHAEQLQKTLEVPAPRVQVVGAGYRRQLFHARRRADAGTRRLLYVGKLSAAKGLPWLLDAFERLLQLQPDLDLHVAGSGAGAEAEALARRLRALAPNVIFHGQLAQPELADLMRRAAVCVLPSFYEGLPLVLVEALACGCRLVATELPGITEQLAPHLGAALEPVPLPRLIGIDTPLPADLPAFVDQLVDAMARALASPPLGDPEQSLPGTLEPFTWRAVFGRVEAVWRMLIG